MRHKTSAHLCSRARGLLAGLVVVAWAGTAQGQEADGRPVGPAALRFSGFGTLGLSHVDAPAGWGFRRELTQSGSGQSWRYDIDTRLGAQVNYSLGSQFELVAQVIARKRGAYASLGDAVEWAYASYRPDADWTLRAGRVNVDAFLMADYRNVGYGFMMVRPPVELYSQLPTTLDGADVSRSWLVGEVQWRAKLMAGTAHVGDLQTGKPSRVRAVAGGMVSREEGGLLLRASVSHARIDLDQTSIRAALTGLDQLGALPVPAVADQARALRERLGASNVGAMFWELGVRQELSDWQWSAEFVRVSARPVTMDDAAYATLGRRLGDFTPYVGYGRASNSIAPLPVPDWQAPLTPVVGAAGAAPAQQLGDTVVAALNNARLQQSTWTLGVRWDFHPQAALKLQWDHVRVRPSGSALWTGSGGQGGSADIATAVVDFIF
ncbi:hypothetical protein ACG04R_14700 [Roseateles sp. BYS78W]|uniref:Porin n=1 Tax=Pelomonas candidula TaxID=3299025 RepID=A0ABW7HDD0_9BURK